MVVCCGGVGCGHKFKVRFDGAGRYGLSVRPEWILGHRYES